MLDILIIGGGPAGLCAGIYAKRSGLDVLLVEKMPYGAGQISLSSRVDNYLGFPGISGYEMGEAFRKHAVDQGLDILEGEVKSLSKEGEVWKAVLGGEAESAGKEGEIRGTAIDAGTIKARAVIYAAGAVYRPLPVEAPPEDLKKFVSYCAVCDGAFCKGKDVAVVGGGNTALGDTVYLAGLCERVYLIHRRNEFRGSKETLDKIKKMENVEIITPANVKKLSGERKETRLWLDNGRELVVSRVFAAIGMMPETKAVSSVVGLDRQGYIIADETGKTDVPGFFAAGDVRKKELRQIITAAADGANAAVSAQEYISNPCQVFI